MISRFWLMGAVAAVFLFGACGGGDSGSTGAAEGEACKGGADCGDGLYCALPSFKATEGACAKLPAGCADSPKCSGACSDALDTSCKGSSACISAFSKITFSCEPNMNGSAPEGAACTVGADCQSGLLCKVKAGAGVCTAAPTECSGSPECTATCGDAIIALCGGGSPGCSGSGTVTLTCE
jgi:hypothetical protein